jgi:hypothetical protein
MYKRGCLLVNPALIADPEVFEALCEGFAIIRFLEVDEHEHIIICEHDQFLEANEGDYLPFYDLILERKDGLLEVKEVGAPYIHTKYFLQCQNQQEEKKQETQDSDSLIWLPDQ